MSLERIRELLELMKEHGLAELELEEPDFKIRLQKAAATLPTLPISSPLQPTGPIVTPLPSKPSPAAGEEENLVPIKSPIVGTFYRASSPDADPYVTEGSPVDKDTIVCIIEAMKIMNEIKAGVKGTIAKILVENGEPVEYGQPLFLVRP